MNYPFQSIENKWQNFWEENKTFSSSEDITKEKLFILDMWPYPSGAGLHVGHPEGYTATDIYCRYLRLTGKNILHPMGWDAFGLPAERYAMQTNIHPSITTAENINTFRRQIKSLGLSYDWDREVSSADPSYFKWTQWIFLEIYNSWFDPRDQKGKYINSLITEFETYGTSKLSTFTKKSFNATEWKNKSEIDKQEILNDFRLAFISEVPVNWCEALGTVLANEEVPEWQEKGYTVVKKPMRQWMMRITTYSNRLLEDLKLLDWPISTLDQQKNWIGKSEGAHIKFQVENNSDSIEVFSTRPDTIFGATFIVLSPEHPLVLKLTSSVKKSEVEKYIISSSLKSDLERGTEKIKSGVFIGSHAINPATKNKIEIWIADYVLLNYGTGAIMGVPGHDERDNLFAEQYKLPIVKVVEGGEKENAFEGEGINCNSENEEVSLNGLKTKEAKVKIISWLEKNKIGKSSITFKLRDWVFSRQRYWGEPIPIINLENGLRVTVPLEQLPLTLPNLKKFQPSGTTDSPLILAEDWVNVVDQKTGLKGKRETNTMPQWAGSCWYYLRYLDPKNENIFCDKEKMKYWMPVDLYVGGSEHAVLHLLYSRFWHKILFDLNHVNTSEPFLKLRHQGIILGEDSRKMSKSRGNVVNPDEVVNKYGADSLRLFEMFMGPLEDSKPWNTHGVEGVFRFLNRVWRLFMNEDGALNSKLSDSFSDNEFERVHHFTIKKITEDIEGLRFNTAISQLMIYVNEIMKLDHFPKKHLKEFLVLVNPFAPHIAEELWELIGNKESITNASWPKYDSSKIIQTEVEIIIQVNGKIRGRINVEFNSPEEFLKTTALNQENVKQYLMDKKIIKEIIVKNKLVNFVIK
ncbi:MAG: leucine--tRNA ligase [Ignavibacteria bacterium]|nr:leucine--tRNA ligase [Ignavibacteria bacterium]